MNKIIVMALIALVSTTAFAQKKKKPVASKPATTVVAKGVLAKVDNLVAEVKTGNFQLTINENGKAKYMDLKTENLTNVYSIVYEIPNKKQVFSNTQTTNHIVEKVFLDKLKNASETQERIRREGFEFILNADGTITQKNKTQENKWKYNPATFEFVDAKKK